MSTPTLELRNLEVAYTVRGIDREVLRNISLSIEPGEAYGLSRRIWLRKINCRIMPQCVISRATARSQVAQFCLRVATW